MHTKLLNRACALPQLYVLRYHAGIQLSVPCIFHQYICLNYTSYMYQLEAATVHPIATHLMQKRLRWYGHVRRRYESHTTKTVMDMVVEGVRPRGRPKLRYMDNIRRHEKEWADGRQHSRSQGLEIGSFKGDPLTWKSLQGENIRTIYSRINTGHHHHHRVASLGGVRDSTSSGALFRTNNRPVYANVIQTQSSF